MTVDSSRNLFFNVKKGTMIIPDKPATNQLNVITKYDDVGYYYHNEKEVTVTVLNYFHPQNLEKPVVIDPYEDNRFLFIITNYAGSGESATVRKKLKEWIVEKINESLYNISEPKTQIRILMNPNNVDITLAINTNTRGIFVFDYSDGKGAELEDINKLLLAESLELKDLMELLKKSDCESVVLGLFSQQIQNLLHDAYAIDQLNGLMKNNDEPSKEIGLLLLPLANKPIEHKMNFEIVACIEFITKLLTDDLGANKNLVSAQETIASRMRENRPKMNHIIPQACAIFLGYQQSRIKGAPSQSEQNMTSTSPFRKTGLDELDRVIEEVRGSGGKFDRDGCTKIQGTLYNYIWKAVQMCNSIVLSKPEYKELFFSLVISMHPNEAFTDGRNRSELGKERIIALWESYEACIDEDSVILGKQTLSLPGGGLGTESNLVNGFIGSLKDLNGLIKSLGSKLILSEISEDFSTSKEKYVSLVKKLKEDDLDVQWSGPGEPILALLLLDAAIAKKIYALIQQLHTVLHGPTIATLDGGFGYHHQCLYTEPRNKRTLNVQTLRTTLNNMGDEIGKGMGKEGHRGNPSGAPMTNTYDLKWWVVE